MRYSRYGKAIKQFLIRINDEVDASAVCETRTFIRWFLRKIHQLRVYSFSLNKQKTLKTTARRNTMAKSDTKKTKSKKKGKSALKKLTGKLKASRKELMSQVDQLTHEINAFKNKHSSKKIIKKLEKKYKKQITNLQQDFNEQLDKLHAMQSKLVDSLPKDVLQKLHISGSEQEVTKPEKKTAASKSKTRAKPKSELSSIDGIGPVTLKKLQEAGITSLNDLANTPESKREALKTF